MRKLALAASAACILLVNCTKRDLPTEENASNALSSISKAKMVLSGGPKSYLIISKQESVSKQLIEKIKALGEVNNSLDQIGVVVASSSNPNFKKELEQLTEVQKVVPDLKLNWLKSTLQQGKVKMFSNKQLPTKSLENSADLGLNGTNPFVPLQWNLLSVKSKGAFQAGYKGKGAVVAILDGGFFLQHPDIKDNVISSKTFVPGQDAEMADPNSFSHATHVAGIVAASDNNIGVAGIAPAAKLMLVKVLGDNGSGAFSWIIQGMLYAADHDADVINMSLGAFIPRNGKFLDDGGTPNDPSDDVVINEAKEVQELITALNRAALYARKKGTLIIAAAGNNAKYVAGQGQGSFYPADCVGVVSVGANAPQDWALNQTTSLYVPTSYTNYGSSLIDLAAPGGDFDGSARLANVLGIVIPSWVFDMVLSAGGGSMGYAWAAGTSMASPAASGVAALIVGKYHGNLSPTQLERKLKNTATDLGALGTDKYFGHGQVNATIAVRQ